MLIREIALRDNLWSQPELPGNRTLESFRSSTFRTLMLWDLLKHSKTFIQAFINLPEAEIPLLGVFTMGRLCTALTTLPKAVSTLLRLVVSHEADPGILNPAQRSEAQAIVDEADYVNLVAELLKKLDLRLQDLSAADREYDVVGSLCSKMRLLAHCYPYRVKAILGEELAPHSTPASQEGAIPIHTSAISQDNTWPGPAQQSGWPLLDLNLEDTSFMLNDAQWASVLDSFTSFS